MPQPLANRLAEFACQLRFEDLPAPVVHETKRRFIDSFATAVGVPRTLQGLNPGSPKDCSLEIISGRHFPDDWQGNLLTGDIDQAVAARVERVACGAGGAGGRGRALAVQTEAVGV